MWLQGMADRLLIVDAILRRDSLEISEDLMDYDARETVALADTAETEFGFDTLGPYVCPLGCAENGVLRETQEAQMHFDAVHGDQPGSKPYIESNRTVECSVCGGPNGMFPLAGFTTPGMPPNELGHWTYADGAFSARPNPRQGSANRAPDCGQDTVLLEPHLGAVLASGG
jgi:hypothetical protein